MDAGLLQHSFEMITNRAPDVARRFYQLLFTRFPQVAPLFRRGNSTHQEAMLTQALVALMDHLEDSAWLTTVLPELGAKHVGYGVTSEMYGWVGECLLATFGEICGDSWSADLAAEWASAYAAVAGLMQSSPRPTEQSRTEEQLQV